jgi:hypothetical protein
MSDKPQGEPGEGDVQKLASEIGAVLRRVVSESPQVSSCLARARNAGFEVSLALEATIAVTRGRRREGEPDPEFALRVEPGEPAPLRMTPLDRKFLRSLKIAVEEEE